MKIYTQFFRKGFFYLLNKLHILGLAFFAVYTAPIDSPSLTRETKPAVQELTQPMTNIHTGKVISGELSLRF